MQKIPARMELGPFTDIRARACVGVGLDTIIPWKVMEPRRRSWVTSWIKALRRILAAC